MILSLRALGLASLLKKPLGISEILLRTTDNEDVVSNTLRELKNKKILMVDTLGNYTVKISSVSVEDFELQAKMIEVLFYKTKPYAIIAWFLEEEGLFISNHTELSTIVSAMYESAKLLQLKNENDLYKAYKLLKEEEGDLQGAQSDAFTLCIERMQRLYSYAERIRCSL